MILERSLRVLEFGKIRAMLSAFALTEMGKKKCAELIPYETASEIERSLDETEEALVILTYLGRHPLIEFSDVSLPLSLASKGSTLSPRALLDVKRFLMAVSIAKAALARNERENTPVLTARAGALVSYHAIEEEIDTAILSEDEIADRASPALFGIRRSIRQANERVREKLSSYLRQSNLSKYLQDGIITMRNDRYVLPVKAEYRSSVPGIVHDQSVTGATLFIEPVAVVEINNQIRELQVQEKQEIERILYELSQLIAPEANTMQMDLEILTELDFIFAKGALAREQFAVRPKINENGYINIVRGRHPLLDPKTVVPLTLWMGKDFTSLIITGPNTGGKTVTLKTVGLFTLMAMAGLHVPADIGTELSVFTQVYADIGDEQSIEQSLSTFSSHMTNIVSIMNTVTYSDLALFDELGAGTDPTEGAALAQAILSKLLSIKARTLATTHYSELKVFALSTKGVENASVEFDVETLSPTYRLSIGVPGKSNAFEISRRLGLSEAVIDDAKRLLSNETVKFEDVIANAEYHRQIAERERMLAEEAKQETVRQRDEAEKLRKEIEEKREIYMRRAREDAKRVLENAKRESEAVLSELKQLKKNGGSLQEHEAQAMRKRLEKGVDELREGLGAKLDAPAVGALKSVQVGQSVEIPSLEAHGTVLSEADNKGEVQVQVGIMKMKVHISRLRLPAEERAKKKTTSVRHDTNAATMQVKLECDVRGMNLEEALISVDQYLAQAVMASYNTVYIIHGKGTGILRKGIQQHLKTCPVVKEYRIGKYGEGEDGVTVVSLK